MRFAIIHVRVLGPMTANAGSNPTDEGLLKNPVLCGFVVRYLDIHSPEKGISAMLGRRNRAQMELFADRFAGEVDSRGSRIGPREPGSGPELAARGGVGLLLRGQRPSGDRPGSGGSPDAGGSSAGVRARPSVDARGAGEPRDPVVHRVRAGGGVAGSFEPDADTAALGRGSVPGDIPAHGPCVPGREGGQGRSGSRGRLLDTCERELGESGGASRGRGDVGAPRRGGGEGLEGGWRRRPWRGFGEGEPNGPGRAAVENGRGIRAELQAARCGGRRERGGARRIGDGGYGERA